jgi:hypothetical protein
MDGLVNHRRRSHGVNLGYVLYYYGQFSGAVTCDTKIRTLGFENGPKYTDFFPINQRQSGETSSSSDIKIEHNYSVRLQEIPSQGTFELSYRFTFCNFIELKSHKLGANEAGMR